MLVSRISDWLTPSPVGYIAAQLTFIHETFPDFSHSLMTKCLYELNSSFFLPAGHLHSEWGNSLPVYTNHKPQKAEIIAPWEKSHQDGWDQSDGPVMPAMGTVKFHGTPLLSSTAPHNPLLSVSPCCGQLLKGCWNSHPHIRILCCLISLAHLPRMTLKPLHLLLAQVHNK